MKVMVLTIHFCCRPFHLSTQRKSKPYVSSSTQSSIQDHCGEAGPRSSQKAKSAGWDQHCRGVRLGADIGAVRLNWAPRGGGRLLLLHSSSQQQSSWPWTQPSYSSRGGLHSGPWHVMLSTHFLDLRNQASSQLMAISNISKNPMSEYKK